MNALLPWLVVLIYLVPIIGTLVSMVRRVGHFWSFSLSLRWFFPEDRFYRKIKAWGGRYNAWKARHPLTSYANLSFLNLLAGKIEYAIGHLRDYTIGVVMMGMFVYTLSRMLFSQDSSIISNRFSSLFYDGFFALLSLWTYRRHVTTGLKMTEFMRGNPFAHPEEFFEHYYRRLSPAAVPIPAKAGRTVDPTDVSYLTGRPPRQSSWLLLHSVYDTAIFARSVYRAVETLGQEYGREIFDVMASLWGSRMLQLFRTRLKVEGVEKFNGLTGKVILVFNHKSILDFVLNFFALSSTRLASGRTIRPRFMASKDHFVDNKFVYNGIGVGKVIEGVDMVFVDRKGKGRLAILDACRKLAEKEIDIAMYPQGTRAMGNYGVHGERLDAGYYTTGTLNSLKKTLGHLKKGCAYLAVDTAMVLKPRNIPVHLVFIGIDGTSTLLPKGSLKIQTEVSVKMTVGDVVTINPAEVEGLERPMDENPQNDSQKRYLDLITRLQEQINRGLLGSLGLHEKLRSRFLREVKEGSLIPTDKLLILNHQLTQAEREENPLPFVILDRIYALPPHDQPPFLREAAQRLIEGGDWITLRNQVTERLFRFRGKELKTMVLQEQAKEKKAS